MSGEAKYCPFCCGLNCHPIKNDESKKWRVYCGGCGASSGSCKTKEQALEAWDVRTYKTDEWGNVI